MLGILGGGFGLYGYLPAAVDSGINDVLLLTKYRKIVETRKELKKYQTNIAWLDSDQKLINLASTLVIARRPSDQLMLIPKLVTQGNLKTIILEKPIAPTPESALRLLETIEQSNKRCSAGFILRYLPWFLDLKEKLASRSFTTSQTLHLKWFFLAHHFSEEIETWKKNHKQGGGVIRFFGIHIIALLSELGFTKVISSEVGDRSQIHKNSLWRAAFKGTGLPEFRVEVDSASLYPYFAITSCEAESRVYADHDIFPSLNNQNTLHKEDKRSVYLRKLLLDSVAPANSEAGSLKKVTSLWKEVESHTAFF